MVVGARERRDMSRPLFPLECCCLADCSFGLTAEPLFEFCLFFLCVFVCLPACLPACLALSLVDLRAKASASVRDCAAFFASSHEGTRRGRVSFGLMRGKSSRRSVYDCG